MKIQENRNTEAYTTMSCNHENVTFHPTPDLKHHGKEICDDCGKFIRWVPKPETLERQIDNRNTIEALEAMELEEWPRNFLASLKKLDGKLSPKQEAKLAELWKEHFR